MTYSVWLICFAVVLANLYFFYRVDKSDYKDIEDLKVAYQTSYIAAVLGLVIMLIILVLMLLSGSSEEQKKPDMLNPVLSISLLDSSPVPPQVTQDL